MVLVLRGAGTNEAVLISDSVYRADDLMTVFPHKGNLHELTALTDDVQFVEIQRPPYDDTQQQRRCQYYRVKQGGDGRTLLVCDEARGFGVAPGTWVPPAERPRRTLSCAIS